MFDVKINTENKTLVVVELKYIKSENLTDYMTEIVDLKYKEVTTYNIYRKPLKMLFKDLKSSMVINYNNIKYIIIHSI